MKSCVLQTVVTDVEHLNIVHFDAAGDGVVSAIMVSTSSRRKSPPLPGCQRLLPSEQGSQTFIAACKRRRAADFLTQSLPSTFYRKSFVSVARGAERGTLQPTQRQADELLAEDKRSQLQTRRWEEEVCFF